MLLQSRQYCLAELLQLARLVPGGETEDQLVRAGVDVVARAFDYRLRGAERAPTLAPEVDAIVATDPVAGLSLGSVYVIVEVDRHVEGGAESRRRAVGRQFLQHETAHAS